MVQSRSACSRRNTWSLSLRTCVLFSIMLHVLLLYIPYHQNKVEAVSGGMCMVLAAGSGNTGQSRSISTSRARPGPRKPEIAAEQQTMHAEQQAVPASKPKPTVQPQRQRTPAPVAERRRKVPPAPKPIVRKQSVVKAKTVSAAVQKKAVSVRKTQSKRVGTRPKKKQIPPHSKPVRKPVAAQAAGSVSPADKQSAAASATRGSKGARNAKHVTGNSGQGHTMQKAVAAGGGTPEGPIRSRIGSLYGPQITRWMRPKYPRKARDMGWTGQVVLRVTIDADGRPVRVKVSKSAGRGFDEAAVAAVRKSAFTPASHKGRPVACVVLLPVRFTLKGQ